MIIKDTPGCQKRKTEEDTMRKITVRSAISVVSAVPILVVYPFLQKYFVTGMALGSVKG